MSGVAFAEGLLALLAAYAAVGAAVAVGFAIAGVRRALPTDGSITLGARLLLMPAAAALWPLVLRRWCAGGRR